MNPLVAIPENGTPLGGSPTPVVSISNLEAMLQKPSDVAQHGLDQYKNNPVLRLINIGFHASMAGSMKPNWRPRHVVVRLVGRHGVGKTAVVSQYAKSEGLEYRKLDAHVTDIAEVFGLKDTKEDRAGNKLTVTAPPDWWPKPNTFGILNVDDMSRALPHVLQPLMQFIFEREFNGLRLPDGWSIVITDNPDDGNYNVSSLDPAQVSRMISVPWNPTEEIELEQLDRQDVHDEMKSFWIGHPHMLRPVPVEVKASDDFNNPRMRMLFNRVYPYLKYDRALLDMVGTAMFGPEFIASLKAFMESEQPILPSEILAGDEYSERLERWTNSGRQDLISLSVERLFRELQLRERMDIQTFEYVSAFLQKVPVDLGARIMKEAAQTQTPFGTRYGGMVARDAKLMERYERTMRSVVDELKKQ